MYCISRFFVSGSTLLCLVVFSAGLGFADNAQAQSVAESEEVLEEVIVTGIRRSLASAIAAKRNSTQVMDAVYVEDIGKLPDNNVAEALQRVPGVRITRSAGEGETVSVRGLSTDLTLVMLNGNVMPSSNTTRQFSFDIVASELVNGLEVFKSPTASMEEGGVGGVVNLALPNPLDVGEHFAVRLQSQYHDFADEYDPRISAFYSHANADNTFGVALTALYAEKSLREDIQHTNYAGLDTDSDGLQDQYIYASYIGWLETSHNEQTGVTLGLQWRPHENLDARLNILYSERVQDFLGNRYGIVNNNPRFDPNQPFEIDNHGTFRYFNNTGFGVPAIRDFTFEEPLLSFDLAIDFNRGPWTITPSVHVADSEQDWVDPWQINANTVTVPVTFDARGNHRDPSFTFGGGGSVDDPDFHPIRFVDAFAITPAEDEASSGALDVTRNIDSGAFSSIEFGAKYSKRRKIHEFAITRFLQDLTQTYSGIEGNFPTGPFFDGESNFPNFWVYPSMSTLRQTPARTVDQSLPQLPSLRPSGSFMSSILIKDQLASYDIKESITAGYVQANFGTDWGSKPVRGNIGVRVVETDQTSIGAARGDGSFTPVVVKRKYTDVLPAINVVMDLKEDLLLRFAAAEVMSRPKPEDISPRKRVETTVATPFIDEANPHLDPFRAFQIDLGIEKYFGSTGLIGATVFYKDIESFITDFSVIENRTEIGVNSQGNSVPVTTDFVVTRPINGDGATVRGFELTIQQSLDGVLSAPFDGLGYVINYSFADSDANYPDQLNIDSQNFPLPDLSRHGVNLIAYYENEKVSARIAYNWRSEFLITPLRNAGLPSFYDSYGQLDVGFNYNFTDRISMQLEGINLTNEINYEYLGIPQRSFRRYMTGRRVLFGLKYVF